MRAWFRTPAGGRRSIGCNRRTRSEWREERERGRGEKRGERARRPYSPPPVAAVASRDETAGVPGIGSRFRTNSAIRAAMKFAIAAM